MNDFIHSKRDYREHVVTIYSFIITHTLVVTVLLFLLIKIVIIFVLLTLFDFYDKSIGTSNQVIQSGDILFDLLGTRWDSYFYLTIAKNGSYDDPLLPGDTRIWNFAPLYPLFIRLFLSYTKEFQVEIPLAAAGVIVANLFSLTSTIAFFYVSRLYLNEEKAIGATLLFSFFPTVLVFSTVAYAEPVFLTFAIMSWYFFEKENYPASGFTLALATLARFPGALIFFLYIPIYVGRKLRQQGLPAIGCLLAIPLFPFLVIINLVNFILFKLNRYFTVKSLSENLCQKLGVTHRRREKYHEIIRFFDINLSWVLIFGIIPLLWIHFVNVVAPMPLHEITYKHWGARFEFPFAGLLDMLNTCDVKWTVEKFSFVFLFIVIGLIALPRRPSFSLLIIAQALFYSGYVGKHAWGIPRYTGTIFHGQFILAEELPSYKITILMLSFFLLYGFKALWEFCNWSIWLI